MIKPTSAQRLQIYANRFPTIGNRGTWDELKAIVDSAESSGTRQSAMFLLNIWNGDEEFNAWDALGTWDEQHFRAFILVLEDRWKHGGL